MKQIMTVFGFTFRESAKKKVFIISTLVITVLIVAAFAIVSLVMTKTDNPSDLPDSSVVGTPDSKCYFIDDGNNLPGAIEYLNLFSASSGVEFIGITQSEFDSKDCRAEISDNKSIFAAFVDVKEGTPFITYLIKDFLTTTDYSWITDCLSTFRAASIMSSQGISDEMIAVSQTKLQSTVESAGEMQVAGYIAGIVILMITFFAIYYYGYGVSMTVANEKTSRVMETLVVSAKPKHILIGKCLAMGTLGLIQFAYILVLVFACYKVFIPSDVLGAGFSLDSLNAGNIALIIVYFLLGYTVYSMLNAVCGATVSKIEDVNSAMMPVMFLAMVSFYVGYMAAVISPDGSLAKVAQFIPFTAPFIIPFKLLNGGIGTLECVISILILVATAVAVAVISCKVYEISVLHYGKRLKIKDIGAMLKDGTKKS